MVGESAVLSLFRSYVDPAELPEEDRVYYGPDHTPPNRRATYKFPNGRGASVIPRGDVWQLAVLGKGGDLDYSTPVTDDTLRGDVEVVKEALAAIKAMP